MGTLSTQTSGGEGRYRARASKEHRQDVPSAVWTIAHGLGSIPAVTVVDSALNEVTGSVQHTDTNNLTITFAFPFSGRAYLA